MKNRLQFNRHFALYNSREEAITALNNRIADPSFIPLIGEPIVLRYKDEDGNIQLILAIGKKAGTTLSEREYHVVDTAELDEKIAAEVVAREELDAETIKKIFFDGIESDFAENVASLSVSANVIPVGEDYESHVIPSNPEGKPHPIHANYTVTDAIKQLDINFIDFKGKAEEKFQELDEKIDAETERATAAEDSISGQTSALSGAVIAFSAETVDELAELSGTAKSIQEELDATQVGAGLGNDGKYTPVENSNYISEASSLRDADAKLDVAVGSLSGVVGSFSANTAAEIEGLKADIAAETERATAAENSISGSVAAFSAKTVSEISRLDGKIDTETERASNIENILSSLTQGLSSSTMSEIERIDSVITRNKVKSTGNTVVVSEAAEGTNLEANIDRKTILSNNGVLKTGLKVAHVSDLEANVREAFRLVDNEGNPVDNTIIKIYKSSSLVNVELVNVSGTDYVRITYIDNEGVTKTMDLNIQQLIFEAEFKDGLTVDAAGEVKVLIDPLSEPYLSVSSNGVKLDGISNAITSAVENEKLRATSAENALRTDLNSEIANRTNADTVLNNAITAETASRISADNVLDSKITTERERAIGVENEIKNNFNSFTASTQSSLTSLNEAINTETTNRINGDTALDNKISVERERAISAETALRASIQAEASARENADNVLEEKIAHEITRATAAENSLNTKIESETTRATAAENSLNTKIESETTRATEAENSLNTKIEAEITRATGAENSLRTSITTAIDDLTLAYTQADQAIVDAYTAAIAQESESRIDTDNMLLNLINGATGDITNLETRLNNEITRATNTENLISGSVINVNNNVTNLSGQLSTFSSSTVNEINNINNRINNLDSKTISGENAIKTNVSGSDTKVSLLINGSDKVLSQDNSGLYTQLSIELSNDGKALYLKGKNGATISTIDTTSFVKDGMLDNVVFDGSSKTLKFTFNTDSGKQQIDVPLGSLVDIYTVSATSTSYMVIDNYKIGLNVDVTNGLASYSALRDVDNKLSYLSGTVQTIDGRVTENTTKINNISGSVINLSAVTVELSAMTSSMSGKTSGILTLKLNGVEQGKYCPSASTSINIDTGQDVSSLSAAVVTNKTNIELLSASTVNIKNIVDNLSGNVVNNINKISSLSSATVNIENIVNNLSGSVVENRELINNISANTYNKNEINQLISGATQTKYTTAGTLANLTLNEFLTIAKIAGDTTLSIATTGLPTLPANGVAERHVIIENTGSTDAVVTVSSDSRIKFTLGNKIAIDRNGGIGELNALITYDGSSYTIYVITI